MITGLPHIHRDIEYARRDGQALTLDAFIPAAAGHARPAVVLIYGGRWSQLDKRSFSAEAAMLARDGFAAFAINYRMLNGRLALPSQIENTHTAIDWIAANAASFRVDPGRISVFGGSSGGHLAALAAVERPACAAGVAIKAAVVWSGFFDLALAHAYQVAAGFLPPLELAIGGPPTECPEKWRRFSPLSHVTAAAPPMQICIATEEVASRMDSEAFARRLEQLGVACELIVLEGTAHAREYEPYAWDAMIGFLKRHG